MALFTVEKQAVFLKASKHDIVHSSGTAFQQEHVYVKTYRMPWSKGLTKRTMGLMDASQFGELDRPGRIRNFDQLRSTLFGTRNNPKVIVADIQPSEVHVKQDLLSKLVSQYNLKYRTSYKPHYSKWKVVNSVWMMADPTRPGRVTIPQTSGFKMAKELMSVPVVSQHSQFIQEDFNSMMTAYRDEPKKRGTRESRANLKKRNPKKYKEAYLYLGTVFVVRFWPTRVPVDLYWSEGIQRRVRTHLAQELKYHATAPMRGISVPSSIRQVEPVKTTGMQDWYVMGSKEAPTISNRFKDTPTGRFKDYHTYTMGKGFTRLKTTERYSLKPLFLVRGRNVDAARAAAQTKLNRMIEKPATAERGYELEKRWLISGKKVISRVALQKYREA
jgi:hypothetical protein